MLGGSAHPNTSGPIRIPPTMSTTTCGRFIRLSRPAMNGAHADTAETTNRVASPVCRSMAVRPGEAW